MKKEKDGVIAELRRQLQSVTGQRTGISAPAQSTVRPDASAPMSASVMSESVVPASPRDTQQLEVQLIEKDDLIKSLQAKVCSDPGYQQQISFQRLGITIAG